MTYNSWGSITTLFAPPPKFYGRRQNLIEKKILRLISHDEMCLCKTNTFFTCETTLLSNDYGCIDPKIKIYLFEKQLIIFSQHELVLLSLYLTSCVINIGH